MKTNNLKIVSTPRAYWIMLRTILSTLWLSLTTIFSVFFKTYHRPTADNRFRKWAEKLLKYVRVQYSIHDHSGFQFDQDRAYVIMSNHASHYDIPLIVVSLPGRSVRMLTKKELFKVPVWGRALQMGEFVSIDREDRSQALADLAYGRRLMESGIVLWVAPEGSRSPTGKLMPFKKGGFRLALDMEATIIPVGIRGSAAILPPKTLTRFSLYQKVEVHIGEPIDTRSFKKSSSKPLMDLVENRIRALTDQ